MFEKMTEKHCACSAQCGDAGWAKQIREIRTAVNTACQGNLSACHFGHACHGFVSAGL